VGSALSEQGIGNCNASEKLLRRDFGRMLARKDYALANQFRRLPGMPERCRVDCLHQ
jgi:hypothetical protein